MAVVVEQFFPLGRFHATRWKQNPFEDRYGEWPPSPWRLLRSLLARWFQYTRETGDDDAEKRDTLLRALASELPAFQLPAATWRGQDLRQYQPTALEQQYKYKKNPKTKKNELDYSFRQVSTTLGVDAYRAIGDRDRVVWMWRQTSLSGEQEELLADLLHRIHYFGRTESFTVMQITENSGEPNCILRTEGSMTSMPVLAHSPAQPLQIDLMLAFTDDKRIANQPLPPGTAWYQAELPAVPRRKPARRRVLSPPRPQVARYALDSTVLPLVTETLPVAEAARCALMGIHGRLTEQNGVRGRSAVLSGKDRDSNPLTGHGHAYYLPTDEDDDGRLDHLTIFARDGFGPDERRALDRLRQLNTGRKGEERYPLRLLLLGMGERDEYCPGPLQASQVWVSATPYVATRHAKTRGRDRIDISSPAARADFIMGDLRDQICAVLRDFDGNADDVQIEPVLDGGGFKVAGRWRPIQFKRFRRKPGDDGGRRPAGAFRLTFARAVPGPIALGWSAHFGMGLFLPQKTLSTATVDST